MGKSIGPMGKGLREKPGAISAAAPGAHRPDEFAAGYSSAGCSPAEPASASPADPMLNNTVAAMKTTTSTRVGIFQPAIEGIFIRP